MKDKWILLYIRPSHWRIPNEINTFDEVKTYI